jgi:hypothetical protein
MISEPFLKPRLTGARFEGGAIPLEVLADLSVLAEMIVEIAKWRYYEVNPERRRVPRGFTDGISLRLVGVDAGSSIPVINLFVPGTTQFPISEAEQYYLEARHAMVEAVGAAEKNSRITDHLPERLLGYFDRFGRNLAEGEAIELSEQSGQTPVRLTKETRRKLILASSAEVFTEETSAVGLVHEFDQRAKTFQLTLPSGSILNRIPVEGQHYDTVLEASNGFRDKVRVRVFGVGSFDRKNRLLAIEKVEHLTILDPLDVRVRIDELKQLQLGWLDGKGVAPNHEGLDWLANVIEAYFPDDVVLPFIFPTPEGNVFAEWSLPPWSPSLEIDFSKKQGEWHSLNLDTDDEKSRKLDLSAKEDWQWLAAQIRDYGGGEAK